MSIVRGFFSGVLAFVLFVVLVLLGTVVAFNMTVLNPDFVTAELDKFDAYSVVVDRAKTLIPNQQFLDDEDIDEIAIELKPWFEEQTDKAVYDFYAYLKEGKELNVVISLEPVRKAVKEKVRESVTKVDAVIPSSFTLTPAVAGSWVMVPLETVRHIVGYVDTAYKALIVIAIFLVFLIALVHWWQPKPITLSLGITFILVGVTCILASMLHALLAQLLGQVVGLSGFMPGVQANLIQLVADLTAPVRMYGIGFLVSGILLIVISVLFRSLESRP